MEDGAEAGEVHGAAFVEALFEVGVFGFVDVDDDEDVVAVLFRAQVVDQCILLFYHGCEGRLGHGVIDTGVFLLCLGREIVRRCLFCLN